MRDIELTTPYRASIHGVVLLFQELSLSNKQIKQLKKLPFWKLLDAIKKKSITKADTRKCDSDIGAIIETFEVSNEEFHINGYSVKFKVEDLKNVFGIEDGRKRIEISRHKKDNSSTFIQRRFSSTSRLTKTIVAQKLKEAAEESEKVNEEDLCRLVMLYLLASLFVPNKSLTLGWGYIDYVENVNEIKQYNWSSHIFDNLHTSLCKGVPADVTGCVIVLPYWVMEKFKICQPKNIETSIVCAKWDLREFSEVLKNSTLDKLTFLETNVSEGIETSEDEDDKYSDDDNNEDRDEENHAGKIDNEKIVYDDYTKGIKIELQAVKEREKCLKTTLYEKEKLIDEMRMKVSLLEKELKTLKGENDDALNEKEKIAETLLFELTEMEVHDVTQQLKASATPASNKQDESLNVVEQGIEGSQRQSDEDMSSFILTQTIGASPIQIYFEETAIELEEQIAKTVEEIVSEHRTSDLDKSKKGSERQADNDILSFVQTQSAYEIDNPMKLDEQMQTPSKFQTREMGMEIAETPNQSASETMSKAIIPYKKLIEPSSMIQRIKRKQETRRNGDGDSTYMFNSKKRKATKNMIENIVIDVEKIDDWSAKTEKKGNKKLKKLPSSWSTTKYLSKEDRVKINETLAKHEDPVTVWIGIAKADENVTTNDILNILSDKSMTSNVINSHARLLMDHHYQQITVEEKYAGFKVFDSLCWTYILHDEYKRAREEKLDSTLKSVPLSTRLWVFPINSNGARGRDVTPNHWTLLVFDRVVKLWIHFNSNKPRDGTKDKYKEDAKCVKDYVINYLKKQVINDDDDNTFNTALKSMKCPQQHFGAVDCGIHVCHIMERLAKGQPVEEEMSLEDTRKYKCHMVTNFLKNFVVP